MLTVAAPITVCLLSPGSGSVLVVLWILVAWNLGRSRKRRPIDHNVGITQQVADRIGGDRLEARVRCNHDIGGAATGGFAEHIVNGSDNHALRTLHELAGSYVAGPDNQ